MNYEIITLEQKMIVGITARTGNSDPNCQQIIGGLWHRLMTEGIEQSIEHKAHAHWIGLYSDYDATTYDVTVGAEVLEKGNTDLSVKIIPAGKFAKFHIKGDVVKDVAMAWGEIWKLPLERSFTGDFEQYLSNENGVAEIDIYVALK